ncbi:MAG: hypothetical protein ACO1OB_24245, partial [Archangium sp.]
MGARSFRCAALISAAFFSACPTSTPSVLFFTASPSVVDPGQSVQLAWDTKNAGTCTIEPGLGSFAPRGATLASPTVTTTYSLDCEGAVSTATVLVREPVRITSFTASPEMSTPDSPVTLTWTSTSAGGCSLSPGGAVAANGSQTVQPAQTTTYTLT